MTFLIGFGLGALSMLAAVIVFVLVMVNRPDKWMGPLW